MIYFVDPYTGKTLPVGENTQSIEHAYKWGFQPKTETDFDKCERVERKQRNETSDNA